jgi:hypothetical protein
VKILIGAAMASPLWAPGLAIAWQAARFRRAWRNR